MKRWVAVIGPNLLVALSCLLTACVTGNYQTADQHRYRGYVEFSTELGGPELTFEPIGKYDDWKIIGTEESIHQIKRYLDSQPQQRDNDSVSYYGAFAYVELDGERLPTNYTTIGGFKAYELRVDRIVQLRPGKPSSMGPYDPAGPRGNQPDVRRVATGSKASLCADSVRPAVATREKPILRLRSQRLPRAVCCP